MQTLKSRRQLVASLCIAFGNGECKPKT